MESPHGGESDIETASVAESTGFIQPQGEMRRIGPTNRLLSAARCLSRGIRSLELGQPLPPTLYRPEIVAPAMHPSMGPSGLED